MNLDHADGNNPRTPEAASRRVLVVDDDVDGAVAMSLLLSYDGFETRVAHNGQDALAAARAFLPEVVFLDIGLPGKDGYDVARELRSEPGLREAALVALTGWGEEEDLRKSRDAGFVRHLVKPVDPELIAATVRDLTPPPTEA